MIEVSEGESIQAAIDSARTGEVIEVHKGVYHEAIRTNKPLRIMGLGAVIDGKHVLPQGREVRKDPVSGNWFVYEGLVDLIGNGITFEGFDVINSLGRTMRLFQGASHNVIRNCRLMHGRTLGILVNHDGVEDNLFENIVLHDMSNFATYSRGAGELDWSAAMNIRGIGTTVRNLYSYENWGEGITIGRSSRNTLLEDSKFRSNYALQIYANHATDVAILRNECVFENPTFYRGGKPSFGIVLNNEGNYSGNETDRVLIEENTVKYCGHNIGIWGRTRPSKNVMIRKNTLVEGFDFAVQTHGEHENIQFLENIIYQEDESKIWNLGGAVIREGNIINPEDPPPPPPPPPDDHQEILSRLDTLETEQAELSVSLQAQADRIERHLKE